MKRWLFIAYVILVLVVGVLDAIRGVDILLAQSTDATAQQAARPPAAPQPPKELAAECVQGAQVVVGWNFQGDHSGYAIERRASAETSFVVLQEQPSCSCAAFDGMDYYDFGAQPATTYAYRVRTFNERRGEKTYSDYSDTILVTTPAAQ